MNFLKSKVGLNLTKLLILMWVFALVVAIAVPIGGLASVTDNGGDMANAIERLSPPIAFGGNSVSEDVDGLAFRFSISNIDITTQNGTKAVYDNASIAIDGETYKITNMGVIAHNGDKNAEYTLEDVNNKSIINIPAVYLYDLDRENDVATFVMRITNIPDDKRDVLVTTIPYAVIEIDGDEAVLYGEKQSNSYDNVLYPEADDDIIPEGGVYIAANGNIYQGGDKFPETVTDGDLYKFDGYEYMYNGYITWEYIKDESGMPIKGEDGEYLTRDIWMPFEEWWYYCKLKDGWGMRYKDTDKETPPNPLTSINGHDVTCAIMTWFQHREIKHAPNIPDSVTNMSYAFSGCNSLLTASKMPENLEEASYCFFDAIELITPPDLSHCAMLYSTEWMFGMCEKMTSLPQLPDSVLVEVSAMFADCYGIVDASEFIIPESVTDLYSMFESCENLVYAPTIPSQVTSIWRTFRNCTSLNTITIDANVSEYREAFKSVDMSKVTILGACDENIKRLMAKTGKNGSSVTIA